MNVAAIVLQQKSFVTTATSEVIMKGCATNVPAITILNANTTLPLVLNSNLGVRMRRLLFNNMKAGTTLKTVTTPNITLQILKYLSLALTLLKQFHSTS